MHWSTVAGVGDVVPVMLLTTETSHVTVPPPPLPDPSHWVTDDTRTLDGVVDVIHVGGA
jgi:hypothetical protein